MSLEALLRNGWTKTIEQRVIDQQTVYCLYGGLRYLAVWNHMFDLTRSSALLAEVVKELFPERVFRLERLSKFEEEFSIITLFNDHVETSHDQVLKVAAEFDRRIAESEI